MSTLIDLADHRPPVCYTVRIVHFWDDRMEFHVEDVADDPRSRRSVADALRRAAGQLEQSVNSNPDILERRVETAMKLSVRTTNVFAANGIVTVGDVVTKTEKELLRLHNFGRRCLHEVRVQLARLELRLRANPSPSKPE